jgi:hypothetical protein
MLVTGLGLAFSTRGICNGVGSNAEPLTVCAGEAVRRARGTKSALHNFLKKAKDGLSQWDPGFEWLVIKMSP